MDNVIFVLWFFLPAGAANSTAVIVSGLPIIKKWKYPLDFYQKYNGKRIFGDHKTVRGLVAGIIAAIFVVHIQKTLFIEVSSSFILADYNNLNTIVLGMLLGGGALIGDAVKSFFKRRRDLKPGSAWFPFDQIDFVIGSSVLTLLYIQLDWYFYLIYLVVGIAAHLITNVSAYILGVKDVPY